MRIKYPRTFHLPWSPGRSSDDKVLKNVNCFIGKEVVVTEKMDGENTTLYTDYLHARSMDSRDHISRHYIKRIHSYLSYKIPENWRVSVENLYASHSIFYNNLEFYIYMFSIWNENNICLSWDDTEKWANVLGIPLPKILYKGIFNEEKIKNCFNGYSSAGGEQEGYVVRLSSSFHYDDFDKSVAKFVREGHVQTEDHWMHKDIIPNELNKTSKYLEMYQ